MTGRPTPAAGELDTTTAIDGHPGAGRRRPRWRTPVTLVLTVALLVVAAGLTVRYRHDHRDEWSYGQLAWRGFDVSDDGRTLTFHAWSSGGCDEPTGIHFSGDPVHGSVTATIEVRRPTVRDGKALYCPATLAIDGPAVPVTLDHRVPEGIVILDGARIVSGQVPFDPMFCDHPISQVVHAGTTLPPEQPC